MFRRISVLVLALFFMSAKPALTCDCIMHPVEYYMPISTYILQVKVLKINESTDPEMRQFYPNVSADVQIDQVFKGNLERGQVVTFSPEEASSCSLNFNKGESYLVFAYKKGQNYCTYNCYPSGSLQYAEINQRIKKIKKFMKKNGVTDHQTKGSS